MKGSELAASLRKLADIVEPYDEIPRVNRYLPPENQLGAAAMLIFLRDMFTVTPKDTFTREEMLVILNTLQNDNEIFELDLVRAFDWEEPE